MNSPSQPVRAAEDAAFCANLVRDRDFARYATTLFAPQDKRRGLLALFAFNAEVNHVRDHVSQPLPGEIRLQWWSDLIEGHDHGDVAGNPVAAELMRAIAAYNLPREPLRRIIEAHIFDVYDDPMPTQEALEAYCQDTSSTVFSLSMIILGAQNEAFEKAARQTGLAQGLCDIIASFPVHTARRQLYLPRDLLDRYGATEADIFSRRMTPALGSTLGHLRAEASSRVERALQVLAAVPEIAPAPFMTLALLRRALSRPPSDVFESDRPSRLAILWTLWRASRSKLFRA